MNIKLGITFKGEAHNYLSSSNILSVEVSKDFKHEECTVKLICVPTERVWNVENALKRYFEDHDDVLEILLTERYIGDGEPHNEPWELHKKILIHTARSFEKHYDKNSHVHPIKYVIYCEGEISG